MDDQRLGDDVVDRHARVERPHRVLEHELDALAEFLQRRRRVSFSVSVSLVPSLNRMRPVSGVIARMMILDNVVLPQPDLPTRPRHSPRFTSKLTSSTASTCFSSPPKKPPLRIAKLLLTFSTSSSGRAEARALRPGMLLREHLAFGHRDLADRRQALARRHAEARHRAQQRLQIGMLRRLEQILHGAGFHDLAVIHDDDLVGDVGDHAQVVRDQQQRHLQFLLQIDHQFQDLRLDGDIQRGGRFIGDQQGRPADQRHRDHRALAQAAR